MKEILTRYFNYSKEDVEKVIIEDLIRKGKIAKAESEKLKPIQIEVTAFPRRGIKDLTVILEKLFDEKSIEITDDDLEIVDINK